LALVVTYDGISLSYHRYQFFAAGENPSIKIG